MFATAVAAVLSAHLLAQIPSPRDSPAPLPKGQRVLARDGDVIVVDRGARVRIIRRNEGVARVIHNADQRWLVILLDWADDNGKQPDGMVDSTYSFYDLNAAWPLGERWQGSVVVEEYSLAGEGGRIGVGLRTEKGLVQLIGGPPAARTADLFAASSSMVISYRGAGAGAPGGRLTFDAAEQREVAQAAARASGENAGGSRTAQSSGDAPVRVGGNIRPPRKIVDAKPVYPQDAQAARVQGVVILEAVIGTDGSVGDARILRSIPLLDQAAIDCVKQWKFEPTQVNGVNVPVIMTVTVNFTLQ